MTNHDQDRPTTLAASPSRERMMALREQLIPLSARKRLDLLLDQNDLPEVLQALPVQDVYGLIRELGIADAMELMEACPPRVLQGCMDLSAWKADRVDPRGLASFYAALFAADKDGAMDKIMRMDAEPRILFLKLHTLTMDITEDGVPDGGGDDHFITPDRKLVVSFVDPPGLPEEASDPFGLGGRGRALARGAARALVEAFTERDPAGISQLMDDIRYELPSQLEEDALRFRTGRMMDLGFPAREDALKVLAYLDPDKVTLHTPGDVRAEDDQPDPDAPDLALALYAVPDDTVADRFLRAAIQGLPPAEQDRVGRDLAILCNWVAVARNIPFGDPDAVRGAVREARITLDLALQYRTRGEPGAGMALLRQAALMDLYRVGHSLTLRLQRQALRLLTPERGRARDVTRMLDAPGGLALAALLPRQPLFFTGLTRPGEVSRRPFASLEELAVAARSLAESAFRLAVGMDVLGVTPESLRKTALGGTNLGEAAEVTLEIMITTALARAAVGGALTSTPLGKVELASLRARLKDGANVARAGDALAAVVAPRAPLPGARTPEDARERCRTLAGVLLGRLDEEVGHVPEQDALDGRFLTRVLVTVD